MRDDVAKPSPTVRAWLAAETEAEHQALHTHPRLERLLSPDLARSELASLLDGYHAFYGRIEDHREALQCWPDMSLAPALRALRADMGRLGPRKRADASGIDGPICAEGCLGALYVLVGAQFGGRVIGRHLRALPQPMTSRFFSDEPEMRGAWSLLLDGLAGYRGNKAALERIRDGAKRTFVQFGAFMSPSGS